MAVGDTICTIRVRTRTGLITPYGDEARLIEERYGDGRLAIGVIGVENGHRGELSADLPAAELGADEFLVDRYNEPIALADAAEGSGAFIDTGRTVRIALVTYPVWRLRRR